MNSYFQLIVNEIVSLGGDVIKFAGDALFAEWQADIHEAQTSRSLAECVAMAATCGARIVSSLSDFSAYGSVSSGNGYMTGSALAVLNVHCGLGAGTIIGIHVGDNEYRREYLIVGDPINQISDACGHAALGELVASREALDLLAQTCRLDDSVTKSQKERCALIAQDNTAKFDPLPGSTWREKSIEMVESRKWEDMSDSKLEEYQNVLSLYVHSVVVDNDRLITDYHRARKLQQRHSEEAELRSVYTMFVNISDICIVGDDSDEDQKKVEAINNIMNLTTRTLDRFCGHLRQFIFDDKGLVLIATFGLRGSTCPNMIADRALPATCLLHDSLRLELGIQSKIGATVGNAYCGVIGGITRHEYAVLGPSVNLAARLMASKLNPGILVDDNVRQNAGKTFAFVALSPVEAKGYADPVPIFEPLRNRERDWGSLQTAFVGREREISQLVSIAKDMVGNCLPTKVALVEASNGLGKTTMIVHAVERISENLRKRSKRVTVLRHVCKESQRNVPLNMFRSILVDLLDIEDELSNLPQGEECYSKSLSNLSNDPMGISSRATSSRVNISSSLNQLIAICEKVEAPPEFTQLIARHLLGVDVAPAVDGRVGLQKPKMPPLDVTLQGLVKLVELCTEQSDLVLLALDDVHYLDDMSSRVVEALLETKRTVLILCTSRPLPKRRTRFGFDLWGNLERSFAEKNRFISMELQRLNEYDIRSMIAKKFGFKEHDVSDSFVEDVFEHSAGEPPFANEILENAKRKNFVKLLPDSETYGLDDGQEPFATVTEMMVHRIDAFDSEVRNLLNVAAVMGDSFEMSDIRSVMHRMSGDVPAIETLLLHADRVQRLLDQLVEEGIIIEDVGETGRQKSVYQRKGTGEITGIRPAGFIEKRTYFFAHGVWRSAIMKMMLRIRQAVIHRYAALVLEQKFGLASTDYMQKMRVFAHWKASGDSTKAATLALAIGDSLEELGMSGDSVKIFDEALSMWEELDDEESEDDVAGFTPEALESIDALDLDFIIRLKCGIGRCAAKMDDPTLCVQSFSSALQILQICPGADELEDRSVVFPVFSGLFHCIRLGKIEQDEDFTYEQLLVKCFLHETRTHGHDIHFLRGLAMQGELCGKLGKYEQAFESHRELEKIYDPGKHSRMMCKTYGVDLAVQSFGRCAIWHLQNNNGMEALEKCRQVLHEFLPKMDPRNVHNTMELIYPVLWVLKDLGKAAEARDAFNEYVVQKFKLYYDEGTLISQPLFAPILMILDLASNLGTKEGQRLDEYRLWAMNPQNLSFGSASNTLMSHFGRAPNSISSEICLLLAEQTDDENERNILLRNGICACTELAIILQTPEFKSSFAYSQTESILEDLEVVAASVGLDVYLE